MEIKMNNELKIKGGLITKNIAGKNIVVPVGGEVNFSGMLTLNETGMFFWKMLEKGCTKEQLLSAVTNEYDIDEKTAAEDIESFIEKLKNTGILED